jgi:hypothetical protein
MASGELEQVDGAVAGAWIKAALDGDWGGRVKNLVPQIYEAYARVFHPTTDEEHDDVTWAEMARRLGTVAHREMQWHAIVGSWDSSNFSDSRWSGGRPDLGEPPIAVVEALRPLLAAHTGTPDSIYLGVSTIRGYAAPRSDVPLYSQTHRDWVILRGPFAAIDRIELELDGGFAIGMGIGIRADDGPEPAEELQEPEAPLWYETPNLIWPEDRAWFVQNEYDFDSTVIGGSRALIDALLASTDLEVWEVDGDVSLTEDADKLNPVPDPPPEPPGHRANMTFQLANNILETLSGKVTRIDADETAAPFIEVTHANGLPWYLRIGRAALSPTDPSPLLGRCLGQIEIDPESYALRGRLDDSMPIEASPLPESDVDHPAWEVELPEHASITFATEVRVKFAGT